MTILYQKRFNEPENFCFCTFMQPKIHQKITYIHIVDCKLFNDD